MLSKLIEQRGGPDKAPRWMVVVRFIGRAVVNLMMLIWLLVVSALAMSGLVAIQGMGGVKQFIAFTLAASCRPTGGCPPYLTPSLLVGVGLGYLIGAALLTCVVEPTVTDDLRARGLAQAKKFSWQQTARETVAAYEAVHT